MLSELLTICNKYNTSVSGAALIAASGLLLHVPLKHTQINLGTHGPVITNENIRITIMIVFSHIGIIYITHVSIILHKVKGILSGIARFNWLARTI